MTVCFQGGWSEDAAFFFLHFCSKIHGLGTTLWHHWQVKGRMQIIELWILLLMCMKTKKFASKYKHLKEFDSARQLGQSISILKKVRLSCKMQYKYLFLPLLLKLLKNIFVLLCKNIYTQCMLGLPWQQQIIFPNPHFWPRDVNWQNPLHSLVAVYFIPFWSFVLSL